MFLFEKAKPGRAILVGLAVGCGIEALNLGLKALLYRQLEKPKVDLMLFDLAKSKVMVSKTVLYIGGAPY